MATPAASPFDAVRRLLAAMAHLLLSRAEFASLELAEAQSRLVRWTALGLAATTLALLALIGGSTLLVLVLWPYAGWISLLVLVLAYGAAAGLVFAKLAREIGAAPPVLAETLRELSNDRDLLVGRLRPDDDEDDAKADPVRVRDPGFDADDLRAHDLRAAARGYDGIDGAPR